MILFKTIRYKNFFSSGNHFIEIPLDQHHTTILVGDSGSGKSTLLDAISFCLFNKPFRNINKGQIVNAVNNKDCIVEVELETQGSDFKIVRGIKPNVFEIYKNGSLINQDANSRDYQQVLEKTILKCGFKTFSQVVVLGAVNFVPFMQMKAADRRAIVEDLLDLEVFSDMNVILKQRLSDIQKYTQTFKSQLDVLQSQLSMHNDFLSDIEKEESKRDSDYKQKAFDLETHVELLKKSIGLTKKDLVAAEEELKKFASLDDMIFEVSQKSVEVSTKIKHVEDGLKFIQLHDNCSSCQQKISSEHRKSIEDESNRLLVEYKNKQENIKKAQKILEDKKTKKQAANNLASKLRLELVRYESELQNKEQEIQALNESKEEKDTVSDRKKKVLFDIDTVKSEIGKVKQKLLKLKEKKDLCDISQTLLKDSGIKAAIVEQYLPFINQQINKFLVDMNFFVQFLLDKNFEESILTAGKDIFSYGNFSEGEKQRIDLAVLFTWRNVAKIKNSVNTNLLIMDEIFDSYLDQDATENVIQVLKSTEFRELNIVVISHKNTIAENFERCIRLRKERNFSVIDMKQ